MFAKRCAISAALCIALAWVLSGFYPFALERYALGYVLSSAALAIVALGGIPATILCISIYTGWEVLSDEEERRPGKMPRAIKADIPYLVPLAILWLAWMTHHFWTVWKDGTGHWIPLLLLAVGAGVGAAIIVRGALHEIFAKPKEAAQPESPAAPAKPPETPDPA